MKHRYNICLTPKWITDISTPSMNMVSRKKEAIMALYSLAGSKQSKSWLINFINVQCLQKQKNRVACIRGRVWWLMIKWLSISVLWACFIPMITTINRRMRKWLIHGYKGGFKTIHTCMTTNRFVVIHSKSYAIWIWKKCHSSVKTGNIMIKINV